MNKLSSRRLESVEKDSRRIQMMNLFANESFRFLLFKLDFNGLGLTNRIRRFEEGNREESEIKAKRVDES